MDTLDRPDFYNDLNKILEEINKECIRINPIERKKCVLLAHLVSNGVVSEMKNNDIVFKELFSRVDYIGSYYSGLKVKAPTSFNMNLIMKLPFYYEYLEIEEDDDVPGFVKIGCSDSLKYNGFSEHTLREVKKWINPSGYIVENKPREWLESILVKTIYNRLRNEIEVIDKTFKVTIKKNGPAYTLDVTVEKVQLEIIFAFTLEFSSHINPPYNFKRSEHSYPWYIVSDSVKKSFYDRVDVHWRIYFPSSERKIIHHKYNLKNILRFLKAFRDAQTNIVIPSYFFINLALMELEHTSQERFWEQRTGFLFVYMLDKLKQCLDRGYMNWYWCESVNLLKHHNPDHLLNMKNQLKNIINKINYLIKTNQRRELKDYIFKLYKY